VENDRDIYSLLSSKRKKEALIVSWRLGPNCMLDGCK